MEENKESTLEPETPEPTTPTPASELYQKAQLAPDQVKDYLASASRDKTIKIWEARSGTCVITLEGHDNWVTDLVFHHNGRFLISVSDDKTLRVWDLNNGR